MFKKILLPTDGSELSTKAVEASMKMAREMGAQVVGMTVVEPYNFDAASEVHIETVAQHDERVDEIAKGRLSALKKIADESNVACETVIAHSSMPYQAIIDMAESRGCDLICMASHGRRGLSALLLGSETQKVLTHTKVPVLVYR